MGLIELLFESAMGFAGVIGVFILLLLIGAGIFFVGSLMVLVPGVLIELFTHDKHSYKLIPWRAALVIGVVVGLFLIRWYLPLAIAGGIGLIVLLLEVIGTRW